jgi:hypothetical protein
MMTWMEQITGQSFINNNFLHIPHLEVLSRDDDLDRTDQWTIKVEKRKNLLSAMMTWIDKSVDNQS